MGVQKMHYIICWRLKKLSFVGQVWPLLDGFLKSYAIISQASLWQVAFKHACFTTENHVTNILLKCANEDQNTHKSHPSPPSFIPFASISIINMYYQMFSSLFNSTPSRWHSSYSYYSIITWKNLVAKLGQVLPIRLDLNEIRVKKNSEKKLKSL